jgi:hypothetical protein
MRSFVLSLLLVAAPAFAEPKNEANSIPLEAKHPRPKKPAKPVDAKKKNPKPDSPPQ